MRTVYCDFCHATLIDSAWDCPAEDFDYGEPRTSLAGDTPPLDGSVGAWIACDECASCVRDGQRDMLVARAVAGNYGAIALPEQIADLAAFLDLFWRHLRGAPVQIGADQLALIASDPPFVREDR